MSLNLESSYLKKLLQNLDEISWSYLDNYQQNFIEKLTYQLSGKLLTSYLGTDLYHYSATGSKNILVIPSLINGPEILDCENASFMQNLASAGFNGYLIDWRASGNNNLSIQDYANIVKYYYNFINQSAIIFGHCFGGLLAIEAATAMGVDRVVTLATPFQFKGFYPESFDFLTSLPPEKIATVISCYFGSKHYFSEISNYSTKQTQLFTLVENWLNRSVPVSKEVIAYVRDFNSFAAIPKQLTVIAAKTDKVVPLPAALALPKELYKYREIIIDSGHIMAVTNKSALVVEVMKNLFASGL